MVAGCAFLFRFGIFEFSSIHRHNICSWLGTTSVRHSSFIDAFDLCRYVAALRDTAVLFHSSSRQLGFVFLHRIAIHAFDLQAGGSDLARDTVSTGRIKKRIGLATLRDLFRWDHSAGLVLSDALGFSVSQVWHD